MVRLCGLLLGMVLVTGCAKQVSEPVPEVELEETPAPKTEAELAEEVLRAYDMGIEKGISEVDVYLLANQLGDLKFDHVRTNTHGSYQVTTFCDFPGSDSTRVIQRTTFGNNPTDRGLFYLDCNDNGWIDTSEMQRGYDTLNNER
ncbi:MAG: hypothetical protein ABIG93_02675 [archaeon]|nr:hypothetical protein [Nanoarchaeota archaeon]